MTVTHATSLKPRPTADEIRRINDRYLVEAVEGFTLCPFARRCREQARLGRIFYELDSDSLSAGRCARDLAGLASSDSEVVLMTFAGPTSHEFWDVDVFERFLKSVRARYAGLGAPTFFLVSFHPRIKLSKTVPLTPSSFVTLLRRAPDPTIQCTRASLLERVQRESMWTPDKLDMFPNGISEEVLEMLHTAVQTDSPLSEDIAAQNYKRVATGAGREALERTIADIAADRARSYGVWG